MWMEWRQLERTVFLNAQGGSTSTPWTNRLQQRIRTAKEYLFADFWNLLQISAAILETLSALLFLMGASPTLPVAAIAAFLMWLEVLYFLRAFEFTGGLVRMVFKVSRCLDCVSAGASHSPSSFQQVFYYTGPFLLILAVVIIGSANCFYLLFSHVSPEGDLMFSSDDTIYETTFKMFQMLVLGDGGVTEDLPMDQPGWVLLVKFLFAAFMLGVNVFMLNLMIGLSPFRCSCR
jgi:hypothetical protein